MKQNYYKEKAKNVQTAMFNPITLRMAKTQ